MDPDMNADDYEGGPSIENEYGSDMDSLILELSLASSYPIGVGGQNMFKGTAAMQALAYRTEKMAKHELKQLEYVIGPLLGLMSTDLNHPIASKAAFGIRTLIPSRTCLNRFVECDGFRIMGKVLDQLLVAGNSLHELGPIRTIIESMAIVYRESARFFDKEIVIVGALRHCVRMLNYGDSSIRGIAASTLAILSNNPEIVRQMFSFGAIAPILKISKMDSSEPEMLAGLGCIVQLVRIPEIASKVVRQGAVPLLAEALHMMNSRTAGVSDSVRNKALLAFAWLSRVENCKKVMAIEKVFLGMERELKSNVPNNNTLVLQMMINLRVVKNEHQTKYCTNVRDRIIGLMENGSGTQWFSRNLATKICVLVYTSLEDKKYFANAGALDSIFNLIQSKNLDLQEVPMVALLSFCVHPDVPFEILKKGYQKILVDVTYAVNENIRDMAVVLLKALILYDYTAISSIIPTDREFLFKPDPNSDPVVYGSEYGGLIQEYLKNIIENRREMKYLLEEFDQETIQREGMTEEELESFQATFMLLDYDCNGSLALDEIKVLMVIMGEKLDEEEIVNLFNEYDEDKSGEMSFTEFCIMMKNWRTRFGTGAAKMYNEVLQRGAIGKGRRALSRWLNKDELDRQAIQEIKDQKRKVEAEKQSQMEKHMGAEKLRVQREMERKMQQQRLAESANLPEI
jgi:hypothetical protein